MVFTLSNGAPAVFAVDSASAETALKTNLVFVVDEADITARDWQVIEYLYGGPGHLEFFKLAESYDAGQLSLYAVAC